MLGAYLLPISSDSKWICILLRGLPMTRHIRLPIWEPLPGVFAHVRCVCSTQLGDGGLRELRWMRVLLRGLLMTRHIRLPIWEPLPGVAARVRCARSAWFEG